MAAPTSPEPPSRAPEETNVQSLALVQNSPKALTYIVWSLGLKALIYESLDPQGSIIFFDVLGRRIQCLRWKVLGPVLKQNSVCRYGSRKGCQPDVLIPAFPRLWYRHQRRCHSGATFAFNLLTLSSTFLTESTVRRCIVFFFFSGFRVSGTTQQRPSQVLNHKGFVREALTGPLEARVSRAELS